MEKTIKISYFQHCTAQTQIHPQHGRIENNSGQQIHSECYYKVCLCDIPRPLFLKVYIGSHSDIYQEWYQQEYLHMYTLQSPYLPKYYPIVFTDTSYPVIGMDFIEAPTLANYFKQHISADRRHVPAFFLSIQQHAHILEQIQDILRLLYEHHILYLDLNPENILILNSNFDISLIDFTFCKYTDCQSLESKYIRCSCRYINPTLQPEKLMLQIVSYFNAFLLYGGNIGLINSALCSEAIDQLFSGHFKHYNCMFSRIYPSNFLITPDKNQRREHEFFHTWNIMENYIHSFLQMLYSAENKN